MSRPIDVAVLGSTGSIGTQTLEVVEAEPDRFRIVALGANSSVDLLAEQALRHRPQVVAVASPEAGAQLRGRLPSGTELVVGEGALVDAVDSSCQVVVNGVVGFAGLDVTLAVLHAGKRLALANKESLIAGGPVVQRAWQTPGAELVPVDSEHAAVHQCLRANDVAERVDRVVLTASGGPFRGRTRAELVDVTIDDALAHPTWSMGPKITVDSSTLMNKGLEVIEAHELFGIDYDRIEVVVHPQSIVHSMVTYTDGSTIAQLSNPDMRLPIAYALAYPDRVATAFGPLDWAAVGPLEFGPPDLEAFPCLGLAYDAGRAGQTAPAWLNAANEVAVAAFLASEIAWIDIPDVCKGVLERHDGASADSVEAVIDADRRARHVARQMIERRT
ncbi:MAG: 1-deoxy-D-xylulose-5-phosphate reductoisomerase [Acidimicrobiia bacterium]|nr:1-deoxy-D-xylulose-5-phosphate reductoisomerase [Acidimicrobiia bacterium]